MKSMTGEFYRFLKKTGAICRGRNLNKEIERTNNIVWSKSREHGFVISALSLDHLEYQRHFNGPKKTCRK
jgi:hypothetical protein